MSASNGSFVGVILAAGKGNRMFPFSSRFPKPLLPVCNKPLLEYHIDAMRQVGITDIYIVIGYHGFEIVRALGAGERFGVRLHYIEQQETKGIAHAVGRLEPHIDKPFLLFLGDIYFQTDQLDRIFDCLSDKEANAVLATKEEHNPAAIRRNFAVILDDKGFVKRVIEKPRHIVNTLKGCGIYLFDLHIFDAIRRTPRTAMRDEYEITDSIQILIDDGFKAVSLRVIREDINLTYPADLLMMNLSALDLSGREHVISSSATIHPEARIVRSVIGDGAEVHHAVGIQDSLIMPGAVVESDREISCSIVMDKEIIPCGATTMSR
jgi:dTDP-glucose pyrophosphorylase